MKLNFNLSYVSAITLIASLLIFVNPVAIGTVGTFIVESVHFITLCLYAFLAIGLTSVVTNKDRFTKEYLDQNNGKVVYDPKNLMDPNALKVLVTILSINLPIIGIAIYSGWWITTIIVTWTVLTTISLFTFIAKFKKKEVK